MLTDQSFANESVTNQPTHLHKEGHAPIQQGSIYYKKVGQGAPIIILHGGPGLTYNHFLPQMTPLAQNHTLVLYDQRGSGRSAHSNTHEQFLTLQQFVSDLDALRKHLQFNKITVLGHSWGSFLAIFYAITYPQHTEKLILMGPQPMCYEGMSAFEEAFDQRLAPLKDQLPSEPVHTSTSSDSEDLIQLYRTLSAAFCYDTAKADELTLSYDPVADQMGRMVAKHLNATLFTGQWDYHDQLAQVTVPTLIIHGVQDPIPLWTAQKLYRSLPNATLVRLDQCGHFPYIEQPKAFFKAVESFLGLSSKRKS